MSRDGHHSPEDAPDQPDLVPAARVGNLAEAGYLVSVLRGEGLDADVLHTKSFSAINGAWLTDYVVRAPSDQLSRVAEVLREEAAAFDEDGESESEASMDEEFRQVVWRPVALMALAGVVSFVVGQHLATANQRGGALSDAVNAVGKPFYTDPGPDGVRHRLTYDERSSRWLLDTDADGDGRFDHRSRFSAVRDTAAIGP